MKKFVLEGRDRVIVFWRTKAQKMGLKSLRPQFFGTFGCNICLNYYFHPIYVFYRAVTNISRVRGI